MSTKNKPIDDLLGQLSPLDVSLCLFLPTTLIVLQVILAFDRFVTNNRSEVRKLLEQEPSLESNIRSVFDSQVHDGLATPADTLSPVCAADRPNTEAQAGHSKHGANPPPNANLQVQTPAFPSDEDFGSPIDIDADERGPVNTSSEERRHGSTKGERPSKLRRKPLAAAKPNAQSTQRYQKAKATARKAIEELGSPKILLQIQQDLTAARDTTMFGYRAQLPNVIHGVENASEQEIIDDICSVRYYFQELNADVTFKTAKARYERSWVAELFYKYKAAPEQWVGSLGVVFARAVLPNARTEGCSTGSLQSKWKCEMLKNRFWHQLRQDFGCGIFAVLPTRLNDE